MVQEIITFLHGPRNHIVEYYCIYIGKGNEYFISIDLRNIFKIFLRKKNELYSTFYIFHESDYQNFSKIVN